MGSLVKYILIFFISFLCFKNVLCQALDSIYLKDLDNRKFSQQEYLEKMDHWLAKEFSLGRTFSQEELTKRLKVYYEISNNSKELSIFKINYYINLANNAEYAKRNGESIYYLEKAEKEILRLYGEKSLIVSARKINVYLDNRNYQKVIQTYQHISPYLLSFPRLIKEKSINLNISVEYISILTPAIEAYVQLKMVKEAASVYVLSEKIYRELKKNLPQDNLSAQYINFYQAKIRFLNSLNGKFLKSQALNALSEMKNVMSNKLLISKQSSNDILGEYYLMSAKYYLLTRDTDSVKIYIDSIRNVPFLNEEQAYQGNIFSALLEAEEGNYRMAFNKMSQVAHSTDSLRSLVVEDIDNLVYAHTEVEVNRHLLTLAQRKARIHDFLIISLIIIFLAIILIAVTISRNKEKASKKIIYQLNQEATLQISIMEERLEFARSEEKKKLAQDLHDSFASKIAGLKNLITIFNNKGITDEQKDDIHRVMIQVSDELYDEARKQSHNLYSENHFNDEDLYINNLMKLVKNALPKSKYFTEIGIDKGALNNISLHIRIQIIYILQEILTNIIKHSSATKVQITVYQENKLLNISIDDNGIGFNTNKIEKKGLGFISIQNRLEPLSGTFSISSDTKGTSISIIIPS
jgi:signal transduction histidine kinase